MPPYLHRKCNNYVIVFKSWYSTSVILFLLPKAIAELRLRVIKRYHVSSRDLLPPMYIIHNQLPVIKLSASENICSVIGYFHEIDLTISHSSLIVVVTSYTWDGFQQYPNSSHFGLGMIFYCCVVGKWKILQSGNN